MFRKALPGDCAAVYSLICNLENRELPFPEFSCIFNSQLLNESYCCLVCEQDDNLSAVLNLRFEDQLHHAGRVAEIMEFAVAPECRRKGLGQEMLEQACIAAKENGCMQIEVDCNLLREDAHRFYLREGMHCFHYKFSRSLTGSDSAENRLGR